MRHVSAKTINQTYPHCLSLNFRKNGFFKMSFRKAIISQAIYLILTLMLTGKTQFFNGAFHLLDGSFYGSDIINNYIMHNKTMRYDASFVRALMYDVLRNNLI